MKRLILLLAISFFGFSPFAHAQSCDLNATPSNFSAQLGAATSGQTLCLGAGTYSTNGKAGVTITSAAGVTANISGAAITTNGVRFVSVNFTAPVCISNAQNVLIDHDSFVNLGQSCTEGRLGLQGNGTGTVISNSLFSGSGPSDGIQLNGNATGYHIGPGNVFQNILQGGCGSVHCDSIQFFGGSNNVIDGNFFYNNSTTIMSPDCNGTPITFTNNVVVPEAASAAPALTIGGGRGDVFDHNTFAGQSNATIRFGNPNGCGLSSNETVTNSILPNGLMLTEGQSSNAIAQDYNLCKSSCTGAHSLTGSASYVGGTLPSSYTGYALSSFSTGKGAASNGTDMGVNTGSTISSAPKPPTNLSVVVN